MALNPMTGPHKTQKRRDTDTEEKPRGVGGGDGREAATSPGTDSRSPQKPEEAGRTLRWSLQTESTLGHLDRECLVSLTKRR